jgi:tetratricopeptide (TPR) repeat protein
MSARENTEQTEITEQTEEGSRCEAFRLFRYFRLFRILSGRLLRALLPPDSFCYNPARVDQNFAKISASLKLLPQSRKGGPMKIRLTALAACGLLLAATSLAQTPAPVTAQDNKDSKDNTAVCHAPVETQAATKPARLVEGYGNVHFPVTTRVAEAQKFFDQGVALMHSFWFYEADRSFEQAARLDPGCAMAQWGIATSAVNEARRDAAVRRAKELAPQASARERLYIAAVEARYSAERDTVQNNAFLGSNESYRRALRKLVSLHPEDNEAKLFLALASMNGYERDGTPRAGTVEAIALCQLVLTKEPRHPGAHHYMIHATESGKRPADGVPHADIYPSLAPKIGHAVHMPGHTYVHVDRWDDAARTFENSTEVDRAYMKETGEKSDHAAGPYAHNTHFLAYVYSMQGRYRDGLRVSQGLIELTKQPGEEKSRAGLEGRLGVLRMLARYDRWDEILDGQTLPDEGPFEVFKAWRLYATALARLGKGDVKAARSDLEALQKEAAWLREKLPKQKGLLQGGRQQQQLRALQVAPLELQARIAASEGRADEAIKLLRDAIEEEIKLGYSEPPIYPNPMEEVAGRVSLQLKRWKEAEEFFRAALERDPGSGRAYFGLMQALQGAGRESEAREAYAKFVKAWAKADADLPEMRRAREIASLLSRPSGGGPLR